MELSPELYPSVHGLAKWPQRHSALWLAISHVNHRAGNASQRNGALQRYAEAGIQEMSKERRI